MSNKSKMVENICRKLCVIRGQNPDEETTYEPFSDKGTSIGFLSIQPRWQTYIKEVEMYLDINYVLHNLPDD